MMHLFMAHELTTGAKWAVNNPKGTIAKDVMAQLSPYVATLLLVRDEFI
jgi:hypothetical protein